MTNAISSYRDSPCGMLRYREIRVWDITRPRVVFIGLHPSSANARRIMDIYTETAAGKGAGAAEVVNLFAFKARSAEGLLELGFPFAEDPENDHAIEQVCRKGNGISYLARAWGDTTPRDLVVTNRIIRVKRILDRLGR